MKPWGTPSLRDPEEEEELEKQSRKEQSEVWIKTRRVVPWKPKEEYIPRRMESATESNASEISTNWPFDLATVEVTVDLVKSFNGMVGSENLIGVSITEIGIVAAKRHR